MSIIVAHYFTKVYLYHLTTNRGSDKADPFFVIDKKNRLSPTELRGKPIHLIGRVAFLSEKQY